MWNRNDYMEEAMRQLNDGEVYRSLDRDPRIEILVKMKELVDKAKAMNVIDSDLACLLIVEHPKTPLLYLLPKIHKTLHKPPGRPIVSGRDSVLHNFSIFLERVLHDSAISSRSYIRDTTDFLDKIEPMVVSNNVILASFDVTSLYTSINHDRVVMAVRRKLETSLLSNTAKEFIYCGLT